MRREVIGDATLYLGDAREIVPGLGRGFADMIFTDPPYGHNNNNGDLIHRWEAALGKRGADAAARPIQNDSPGAAHELASWLFENASDWLARGGCCCCCCCCGGGGPDPQFARWALLMDQQLDFKQMVVWDKGPIGMGWHYRRSYEVVLVAQKRGGPCKWYDTTDRVENIIRPDSGIRKILPAKDDHPTPKPWQLAGRFIQLHTRPGETVLDPFMGSGTTGIACVNLDRKFIGVEIEEKWFDLARRRIEAALRQPRLFREPSPAREQGALL